MDGETLVRVRNPGISDPFDQVTDITQPGMRLQVVFNGDYALMLRKATEA